MAAAADPLYADYRYRPAEIAHGFGPQVHLLADPVLLSQLARLCQARCVQPEISRLTADLYRAMAAIAVAAELPRAQVAVPTRMAASDPEAIWRGAIVDPATRAVVVDIARAGTLPAQTTFILLCELLDPAGVRQDHIYMNRATDAAGRVTGVEVAGSKVGGTAAGAVVFVPDPMGATGGTVAHVAGMYAGMAGGAPRRLIALNLIVTPEYLRALTAAHPDVVIYAVRLDRGRSAPDVYARAPGGSGDKESGLNERQYIIPGAGGLGEVLNNTDA